MKFDFDVLIQRPKPLSEVQNIGELTIYEDMEKPIFDCKTVELGWHNNVNKISCIPNGYYKVKKRVTAKRGIHWILQDVPNRSYILIHDKVNYVGSKNPKTGHSDVLGCIIPCFELKDLNKDGILDIAPRSSTKALTKFNEAMKYIEKDEFILKIE
jgi:hypothetical protein